jgi:hypothetical protein
MQPKRSVGYRLLKDLGIRIELRFGTPAEYIQLDLTRTDSGLIVTAPKHLLYGVLKNTPLTRVSFKELLEATPAEANALLWKTLQSNYHEIKRQLPHEKAFNLTQEEKWSLEEFCLMKGYNPEQTRLILESASVVSTIVAEATTAKDFEEGSLL